MALFIIALAKNNTIYEAAFTSSQVVNVQDTKAFWLTLYKM